MSGRYYEHLREIKLDRQGNTVRLILETASDAVPEKAEQLSKDLAASLAMYAGRLQPFPDQIRIRFDDLPSAPETRPESLSENGAPPLMEKVAPRFTLDEFICDPPFRHVLNDVLFYAGHYREIRSRMGIKSVTRSFLVNFFGESGTGKTMVAEAFANALGRDLYVMNFANVESSLLGRTPKNIVRAFREIAPETAIIMLDEADAFVSRRIADLRQGAEYALNTARGQIINEIDRFDGMIILATNLFGTYDNAVLRRIKFNLFFELPNQAAIAQMFRNVLAKAPGLPVLNFDSLAEAAAGLSGGDVYNLSEIIVMKAMQRQAGANVAGADMAGADMAGAVSALELSEIDRIIRYYRRKNRQGGVIRPAENQSETPANE